MWTKSKLRRSREQCKFTCNCRGAPVYVDEVQIAQKPRAVQVYLQLPRRPSICGRSPNCAEAESNASLLAIAEAPQYMWTKSKLRRSREQCKNFAFFVASCGSRFLEPFLFALYRNGIESRELLPLWQEQPVIALLIGTMGRIVIPSAIRNGT